VIASFQNLEQKLTKFLKNFKIPGNSRLEFSNCRELSPEIFRMSDFREFPVALLQSRVDHHPISHAHQSSSTTATLLINKLIADSRDMILVSVILWTVFFWKFHYCMDQTKPNPTQPNPNHGWIRPILPIHLSINDVSYRSRSSSSSPVCLAPS